MRDIEEISEKVEKRKQHLQTLFEKDKENYDLWAGVEQVFDDHKMAINITGTEMVAKALSVQASLTRSRLDVHVYPPDKYANPKGYDAANQEERMYYYGFNKADERLAMIGEPSLLASAAWQATVLGRIAVRVLVYQNKQGEIAWDFLPLVPAFLAFEFDSQGLAWYCYETFRSAGSIKSEYKVEVDDDARGVSVNEYWDRDHNVRYLTKGKTQLGKVWRNPFGEVPMIFQPVSRAPKAISSSGIDVKTWGESIFDHVKTPFRNLNKLRSIAATHAHILAKNPTEIIYEDGTDPNIEEEHFEFYAGSKVKHPKSVVFQPMKQNDIPSSLVTMMGDISAGIERATYAELNPDKPAHSGSALRILGQDKQDVLSPRMQTLNNMYTRICRMVKRQIIMQGLSIPVRTVKNRMYEVFDMTPEFLDNDFYVSAELIGQDVYDEVEALQRAQMLMSLRLKSREDVMETVMGEQDTQTQIDKMDIEDVEAAAPELKFKRVIKTYQKREMAEEAAQAEEQLGILEIQKQQALDAMRPSPEGGSPEGPRLRGPQTRGPQPRGPQPRGSRPRGPRPEGRPPAGRGY